MDSHLALGPTQSKDSTGIKVYRIGKLLERGNLLPSTIGIYRAGMKAFANAAVISTEVYDAFERKEETLVDPKDVHNRGPTNSF